jgi:hypothetical protein
VRKWYSARDAVMKERRPNKDDGRIRPRINLQEESQNHRRTKEDSGRHSKVTIERGNETQRSELADLQLGYEE